MKAELSDPAMLGLMVISVLFGVGVMITMATSALWSRIDKLEKQLKGE